MNVLILDDNQLNLRLFSHVLQGVAGVSTVEQDDPVKALEWCRHHKPDLVLLDYMMPVMDGLDFLARLRAMFVDEPVAAIMITADVDRTVRHRALQLGADDFLTKPMDNIELQSRVRNLLARRRGDVALQARAHSLEVSLADSVNEAACMIAAGELDAVNRMSRMAEFRDPETGNHLMRMAHYARVLAIGLGLDEAEQELIRAAAPMHDIGKIGIPDHILLKRGGLDEAEMACMRAHPAIGAEIIGDSTSPILRAAAIIALHHHEKFDGSGYPAGLAGSDIPLYGRIVAVADVFDALTSARPYKGAWDVERAFAYVRDGAGSHFDPLCVAAFLAERQAVLTIHAAFRDAGPH